MLDVISKLKEKLDGDLDIECGYEAGCLGFSLYHELKNAGVKCVVMAPTTMLSPQRKRVRTDARDAEMIAQCLAHGGYQPVHVPSEHDLDTKRFIRIRDDHRLDLKRKKQQINSFCMLEGFKYEGTKWTKAHLEWLQKPEMDEADRETLNEYLQTYNYLCDRLASMDKRIAEISSPEPYMEKADKLQCFIGMKELAAMKCITETSDFDRFPTAGAYASCAGLGPGEHSSGESLHRTGITKAGSGVLRTALIEAAECICRGKAGQKSRDLRRRQAKCDPETVAYADKANERLRRKYYRMIRKDKPRNVAVTAVARELACFVWGMMTGRTV